MKIQITKATGNRLKQKPVDEDQLGFGTYFSDHMFLMNYEEGKGWFNPRIEAYDDLRLDPAAMSLHYGQEIFEGLKAYRGPSDEIYLFRPEDNFRRFNRSAVRLCMPEVEIELVMEGLKQLIRTDRNWIPQSDGTSLYIRPVMLATEPHIGVRPSKSYLFYIIVSPVGAYYPTGIKPVSIHIESTYIRAAAGGIGEAKAAANYAASMLAAEKAKKAGFSQVLWLDAVERKYIEEVGTMNIFFVLNDSIITPPLAGSILPGITRDSVIQLTRNWGIDVSELPISVDDIVRQIGNGQIKECFGAGTATIISPVGKIGYNGDNLTVGDGGMGNLSRKLYNSIMGIQHGTEVDPFGWRVAVLEGKSTHRYTYYNTVNKGIKLLAPDSTGAYSDPFRL